MSTSSAVTNCASIHNGNLIFCITPTKKEVGHVQSYYSDHYQRYGVNVQAASDAFCRFIYIGVAGTGSMVDRDDSRQIELNDCIKGVPDSFCFIGDAFQFYMAMYQKWLQTIASIILQANKGLEFK